MASSSFFSQYFFCNKTISGFVNPCFCKRQTCPRTASSKSSPPGYKWRHAQQRLHKARRGQRIASHWSHPKETRGSSGLSSYSGLYKNAKSLDFVDFWSENSISENLIEYTEITWTYSFPNCWIFFHRFMFNPPFSLSFAKIQSSPRKLQQSCFTQDVFVTASSIQVS